MYIDINVKKKKEGCIGQHGVRASVGANKTLDGLKIIFFKQGTKLMMATKLHLLESRLK